MKLKDPRLYLNSQRDLFFLTEFFKKNKINFYKKKFKI